MLWNSVSFTGFFGIFIPAPVASGARRDAASDAGAEAFRRGVLICVVDCDKQKELSNLHQVRGIPDLRLYRKGAEVKRKTGYGGSLADLETWQKDG